MYCQTNVFLIISFGIISFIELISNAKVVKSKRAFIDKEHEFLKHHPLSLDLQNFISEIRKSRKNFYKRNLEENSTIIDSQVTKDITEEMEILHKISDDVQRLMIRNEESPNEGALCNLKGSWLSDVGGCRLDIDFNSKTRHKFRINLGEKIPPSSDGFLNTDGWTVFGEKPFEHSELIIVLAIHDSDKHLATFIGECRTCEGEESVTGTWLIGRTSRDCKDQKVAYKVLMDVWRREMVQTLRDKHLEEIGYTTNKIN